MSSNKFSWTLNNYTDEEVASLEEYAASEECKYVVYGYETAPETGTPHLQGYTVFAKRCSPNTVKNRYNGFAWVARAHFEIAAGSEKQNRDYCLKLRPSDPAPNQHYFEKDNRKQGQRSDLSEAISELKLNGITGVVNRFPEVYARYANNLERLYVRLNATVRSEPPTVLWFFGVTGTGKSRMARELAQGQTTWWSGKDLRWFQSYVQQNVAIIDDFRADFCKFHELLRLLDRYPYEVEFKGSSINFNSRLIIITSAYPPTEVYKKSPEDVGQLLRRISQVVRFDQDPEYPLNAQVVDYGQYLQVVSTRLFDRESAPGYSCVETSDYSNGAGDLRVSQAGSESPVSAVGPESSHPSPTGRVFEEEPVTELGLAHRFGTASGQPAARRRRLGQGELTRVASTPTAPSISSTQSFNLGDYPGGLDYGGDLFAGF